MSEKILEFCQIPRTREEIAKFVKMKTKHYAIKLFINPLIEQGKIKLTLPDFPHSIHQQYINAAEINAENETPDAPQVVVTEEAILSYCMIPRKKNDIRKFFNISMSRFKRYMENLWLSGRLICNMPEHPEYPWIKVLNRESNYLETEEGRKRFYQIGKPSKKGVIYDRLPEDATELILQYCLVPRSRQEIAGYLAVKRENAIRRINALVVEGKLKMTQPEKAKNINNRFVRADVDIQVLTEEQVIEFCKTPRNRREIAEQFNLLQHQATSYVKEMVKRGSLKLTNLIAPESSEQLLIAPEVEHPILTERSLMEFCKEPRSSKEIVEHFRLPSTKMLTQYLSLFIKMGKMKFTIPEQPKNRFQKYVFVVQ